MCEVLDKVENRGRAKGENRILTLMQKLFAAGRVVDTEKAVNDRIFLSELLCEFGL